ncbi:MULTISPECIES: hypothetical protein [Mesorhizobium]|uniref:Twin-arginine translocation signal domain-containing protein n=1 Tax=Mesorhizobium salmacidum TaxID=3015171 RepID=A0ABU8KTA2_9HYPH|nr:MULTISPECIES: hypothetical protein [unclassified Mesorhizobium]
MAGATGKAAAQVYTRSRMYGREGLDGGFFVLDPNTQSTERRSQGAQPETTMTKRIGTTSLKDFTRRDFLVSSAMTAVLFTVALLLFPTGTKPEGKAPQVIAQGAASSR